MSKRALEGVRIVKLGAGIAGPAATRILSKAGAEVIRIESRPRARQDRGYVPPWEPDLGLQPDIAGPKHNDWNAGDRSLAIDIVHPRGAEIFRRLVRVSDVVFTSFSAPGAKKLGVDYDKLTLIKPDIIVVRMPGYATKGPYSDYVSWGTNLVAIAGITAQIGYPDVDEPMGVAGITLADATGALAGALSVLNALHYRARTGKGQLVDVSQFAVSAATIGPAIMNYTANEKVAGPVGNRSPHAAPHGVYRCKGNDRWCAIAARSEQEWEGFSRAIGKPGWCTEARFSSLSTRLQNNDELDRLVEEFTSQRDRYEVMFLMQNEGVPAGVVQNPDDLLLRDLQLGARAFFARTEQREAGSYLTHGSPIRLSGMPEVVETGIPNLGQDNAYVLKELLGMTDSEMDDLAQVGVIYPPKEIDPRLKNRSLNTNWTGELHSSLPRADRLRWK